ncbi:MAG: hypothetical protein NT128_08240 [Proteobacteria bacterium]|nr:hypothetical protein [Pseudomonadota bacterium]
MRNIILGFCWVLALNGVKAADSTVEQEIPQHRTLTPGWVLLWQQIDPEDYVRPLVGDVTKKEEDTNQAPAKNEEPATPPNTAR